MPRGFQNTRQNQSTQLWAFDETGLGLKRSSPLCRKFSLAKLAPSLPDPLISDHCFYRL